MVATVAAWIIAIISATGYLGVMLLMAVESACIPIPSEVIMPFAGALAASGRFSLWGAALAGAVGCNLGSTLAYLVGKHGGRRAVLRWGGNVLVTAQDLDHAERFFARFGGAAVFIARLLPVLRTFIALPAGIARMNAWWFQGLTFVGSFIWCYALALVGAKLGQQWRDDPALSAVLHRADAVVVLAVLAGAAWFVWHRLRAARPR